MTTDHPEVNRLRTLATRHRLRCVELESLFSNYVIGSLKKLLAARSAKPEEYRQVEERQKVLKTRAELLEMFVKSDVGHKNGMTYAEFKNAMLLMGFMSDESVIEKTFNRLDVNVDHMISEDEFLAGVLGKQNFEDFSFRHQIELLNREVKNVELKTAEDGDEIEKLLLENEQLRGEFGPEEFQRLKEELDAKNSLLNDMTAVQGEYQSKLKQDLEREIHRLREFGTAMRNNLNLSQREAIVGVRSAARKILEMSGALEEELSTFDRETERSQLTTQVRQVFINLDDQHMGDINLEKFQQAFQWLSINTSPDKLTRQFHQLDTNNTGLIDEDTFVSAVVSEYDVADYTIKAQSDYLMGRLSDFDDHLSELVGGDVSQKLRDRIRQMKADMDSQVGKLFTKLGLDPAKFLSPEVLEKHLGDAFDKFDYTGDGRLSFKEFCEAWRDLGLKASGDELREAFDTVDTDKSGLVDKHEFISAVKENRLTELNMNVLLEAMGVEIGSVADKYKNYASTQSRRRAKRKTMEATLASSMSDIADVLCKIMGVERDSEKTKVTTEMRDTFDRFDRNASGELNYEEYKQAWRYLGRPGTDVDIKTAFDNVDIDNSGMVEWDEFMFSLLGNEAQKYGLLADMEIMIPMLNDLSTDLIDLRSTRTDAEKKLRQLVSRLETLNNEVQVRTAGLVEKLQRTSGSSKSVGVSDLDDSIRESFRQHDTNNSGSLNLWQFTQAWMGLGLSGDEQDIKEAFASANRFGSSSLDERNFLRLVKTERLEELGIRARLTTLERLFDETSGGNSTALRRRLLRQKIDEEIETYLEKMIDSVLPATDDTLSHGYLAKKDRYLALKSAFNKYDNPKVGQLKLSQFKDAMRHVGFSGTDSDLEKRFNNVDVEGSGAVDFFEFVLSDLGKKANKVGSLGYAKILNKLLGNATERFKKVTDPGQNFGPTSPGNTRNAIRLNARKMVQRMTGFGGVDKNQLEKLGIRHDRRAHSIAAGMLEHILHD